MRTLAFNCFDRYINNFWMISVLSVLHLHCVGPGEDYTVEQSYEKEERLQQRQLEFLGALSSDIDM